MSKVYLRVKPYPKEIKLTQEQQDTYKIVDTSTLSTRLPTSENNISCLKRPSTDVVCKKFSFTRIFGPDTAQQELFEQAVMKQMVQFLSGRNCTIMTHGTTNAGKSYTLHGTATSPGIIPRCLEFMFSSITMESTPRYKPTNHCDIVCLDRLKLAQELQIKTELLASASADKHRCVNTYKEMQKLLEEEPPIRPSQCIDAHYSVWVSFAEIYNEIVYDLLSTEGQKMRTPLQLATDSKGRAYIKGLKTVCVNSGSEAYQILMAGQYNLKVAATALNATSSRSHCIFTIKLLKYRTKNNTEPVAVSTFAFCDLAGTERLKKTLNIGNRLKESQNINTSLLVLGRCLKIIHDAQLSRQKIEHPGPFRESKLTRLLQQALSGKEHIALIVNINPVPMLYQETHNVLNFSAIAKKIVLERKENMCRKRRSRFSEMVGQSIETVTVWDTTECQTERNTAPVTDGNGTSCCTQQKQVEKLTLLLNEAKADYLASTKEVKEKEDIIKQHEEDLIEKEETIGYLEADLDICFTEKTKVQEILEESLKPENKMAEHTSNMQDMQDKINRLENEKLLLSVGRSEMAEKIITIEAENSALKERLAQNVTEIQSLKEDLEAAKVKLQDICNLQINSAKPKIENDEPVQLNEIVETAEIGCQVDIRSEKPHTNSTEPDLQNRSCQTVECIGEEESSETSFVGEPGDHDVILDELGKRIVKYNDVISRYEEECLVLDKLDPQILLSLIQRVKKSLSEQGNANNVVIEEYKESIALLRKEHSVAKEKITRLEQALRDSDNIKVYLEKKVKDYEQLNETEKDLSLTKCDYSQCSDKPNTLQEGFDSHTSKLRNEHEKATTILQKEVDNIKKELSVGVKNNDIKSQQSAHERQADNDRLRNLNEEVKSSSIEKERETEAFIKHPRVYKIVSEYENLVKNKQQKLGKQKRVLPKVNIDYCESTSEEEVVVQKKLRAWRPPKRYERSPKPTELSDSKRSGKRIVVPRHSPEAISDAYLTADESF